MKELREYQQSEAYKMCTEKIQEKKIKKGGLWSSGCRRRCPDPAKCCQNLSRDAGLAPRGNFLSPFQRTRALRQ